MLLAVGGVALAVMLLAGTVFALGRGGGGNTDGQGSETATEDGSAPEGETPAGDPEDVPESVPENEVPTTTEPVLSFEEQVDLTILTAADAPTDSVFQSSTVNEGQFCDGVDNVRTVHPGEATRVAEMEGPSNNFFLVQATAHSSVDAAHRAIEYANRLQTTCDGQPVEAGEDPQIYSLSVATEVDVAGAEEFSATVVATGGSGLALELLTIYARSGNVTVFSTGSHRATTEYNAELMIARLTGQPPPVKVEPESPAGAGFETEAATAVRAFVDSLGDQATPGIVQWLDAHPDEDLDALADRVCSAMRGSADRDEAARNLSELYESIDPELRDGLTADEFAELSGLAVALYCPEEAERLGLL